MNKRNRTRSLGFTLVEMLVVIAIIGILAAILLPAIQKVLKTAKENRIAQEVSQLHQAVESYKQKFGDYPPDFSSVRVVGDLSDANNIVARHLRKAFPRHTENAASFAAFFVDSSGSFHVPDPSEALVFWLCRLKNDPRQPLSSATTERHVFFPFDEARLVDVDNNGWVSYVPKDGKNVPYVYFDSRTYQFTYGGSPAFSSYPGYPATTATGVWPYKSNSNSTAPNFANPTTFQIISAGLDGDYGPTTGVSTYNYRWFPNGTNYELGDMDNITNFSEGKTLQDHVE
jgi:prepilin-type N-terminal cleavage/methylation domain-containing protein